MTRPTKRRRPFLAAMIALVSAVLLLVAAGEPAPFSEPDPERLLRQGRWEEAAAAYARRIRSHPRDGRAVHGRVRALLGQDRWKEALSEAESAHSRQPGAIAVCTALAEAHFRAGRLERVDAILAPVVDRAPAEPRALATLGRLRAAQGRHGEAKALLARACELAPDDRDVLYWSADLAAGRADAVRLMRRYLELSEGDDPGRIESARAMVRFFDALGDTRLWVPETRPERVELPLIQIWDAQGVVIGYAVEARLGPKGKKVRLLLDTGAHGLFIVERKTRKTGFSPLAEGTLFGGGGKGKHSTTRGLFSSFALGELRFENALAKVTGEFDATGRYHGLLGISIFAGYRVTLDLDRRRLTLNLPTDDPSGESFWWVSGQMLVRAGAGSGAEGLFIFDTGASGTVLASTFIEELEEATVGEATAVRSFGGMVPEARWVDDVELGFGGLRTSGPLRTYDLSTRSKLGGVEISGLLGLDLLGQRRIVIDPVAQRVGIASGRHER